MPSTRKKVVTSAIATIAFASTLVVGSTYSLYHNETTISNHLVATNLTAKLTRTNLTYSTYGNSGLEVVNVKTDGSVVEDTIVKNPEIDFSNDNEHSIFANIAKDETEITGFAPGLYREATLRLYSENAIPFNYYLSFKFTEEFVSNDDLSKQIKLTISSGEYSTSFTLSQMQKDVKDGEEYLGKVLGNSFNEFTVKVEFLDDCDPASGLQPGDNNKAADKEVSFDMVVYAIQSLN